MPRQEQLEIIVRMRDFASKQFKSMGSAIAGAPRTARRALFSFRGAVTGVLGALGVKEFVQFAGRLQGVDVAFQSMTQRMGGAQLVLADLRRATRGAINEFELMRITNNAVVLGVTDSREELAELANVARRLGKAVGRDATQAFSDLVFGVGRMSRLILDNLGIVVRSEEAQRRFADSLGKTTAELTEQEKRQAFLQETLRAANDALERFGEDAVTVSEQFNRMVATFQDFGIAITRLLIPIIGKLFDLFTLNLDDLLKATVTILNEMVSLADKLVKAIAALAKEVNDVAKSLRETFQLVTDLKNAAGQGLVSALVPEEGDTRGFFDRLFEDAAASFVADKIKDNIVDPLVGDGGANDTSVLDALEEVGDASTKALEALSEALGKINDAVPKASLEALNELLNERRIAAYNSSLNLLRSNFEDLSGFFTGLVTPPPAATFQGPTETKEQEAARKQRLKDEKEIAEAIRKKAEAEREANARLLEGQAEYRLQHDAVVGLQAGFNDLLVASQKWGEAARQAVNDVGNAIASELTEGLVSIIDGTKSAEEAFRDFAKNVLKSIAEIIIQMLILKAIQASLGGGGGAIAGLFAQSGGVVPARPGGTPVTVGEAGQSEAIVPLPNNRSIPVEFKGQTTAGGSPQITQNIIFNHSFSSPADERRLIERNKKGIVNAVVEANNSSLRSNRGLA